MKCKHSALPPLPKHISISNTVLLCLCALGGLVYAFIKGLEVKIPFSFCFLLLGCINTGFVFKHLRASRAFAFTMFAGLLFGFLADILLELNFLIGAAVFAIGHVFYVAAYSLIFPFGKKDLLPFFLLLLCIGSLILFAPFLDFGGSFMQGVALAYSLILSLMLGKAIGNFRRESNPMTKLLLFGSVLFFFSDTMLLLDLFGNVGRIANIFCIFTYYPGQAILAHSICRKD